MRSSLCFTSLLVLSIVYTFNCHGQKTEDSIKFNNWTKARSFYIEKGIGRGAYAWSSVYPFASFSVRTGYRHQLYKGYKDVSWAVLYPIASYTHNYNISNFNSYSPYSFSVGGIGLLCFHEFSNKFAFEFGAVTYPHIQGFRYSNTNEMLFGFATGLELNLRFSRFYINSNGAVSMTVSNSSILFGSFINLGLGANFGRISN